jgi:AcrR family transcriptional regulator
MAPMTAAVGLRERKKARTREALQDAALELFTRQGFDGTTVEEIADACEVSPRTFFRYFPTKEEVLFADAARRREHLLTAIAERPPEEPALLALEAAMRELARDYQQDRDTLVARAKVIKGSLQLQLYQAEHQHGWEADVVAALERRTDALPVLDHDELLLLTAVITAALRVSLDVWIGRKRGRGLLDLLDDAFARLATGFQPVPR